MQPPYTPLPVQAISPRRRAVGPRRWRLPSLRQRGLLHDVKQRLDSNTLAGFERAPPRWRHRAARNRSAGTYAERLGRACALPHPCIKRVALYHGGAALHLREGLADALDREVDPVRRPDVDEEDMVLPGLHQLAQPRLQLGPPPPREPALEDGELDPLAIAVHRLEHAPPAPAVADVIGHDEQALVAHRAHRGR